MATPTFWRRLLILLRLRQQDSANMAAPSDQAPQAPPTPETFIRIPRATTEQDEQGKPFTTYHIEVVGANGKPSCAISKRYSDIAAFHDQLKQHFPKLDDAPVIPPKKLRGNADPAFVELRRQHLERYLCDLFALADPFRGVLWSFADPLCEWGRTPPSVDDGKKDDQLLVVKALYDFAAEDENQLTIRRNDLITVKERDETTGWWFGQLGPRTGYFPGSYVKLPKDRVFTPVHLMARSWEQYLKSELWFTVSIPFAQRGSGDFIVYEIEISRTSDETKKSRHRRRYKEFVSLHRNLRQRFPRVMLPPLPPKNLKRRNGFDDAFIEKRRAALEVYLRTLFNIGDPYRSLLWGWINPAAMSLSDAPADPDLSTVATEEEEEMWARALVDYTADEEEGTISFKKGDTLRVRRTRDITALGTSDIWWDGDVVDDMGTVRTSRSGHFPAHMVQLLEGGSGSTKTEI